MVATIKMNKSFMIFQTKKNKIIKFNVFAFSIYKSQNKEQDRENLQNGGVSSHKE